MVLFGAGQIWCDMFGNQMAQTALDAPSDTFARCIQHLVTENSQSHFWLYQCLSKPMHHGAFRAGQIWSDMFGNQKAQTALDAPS